MKIQENNHDKKLRELYSSFDLEGIQKYNIENCIIIDRDNNELNKLFLLLRAASPLTRDRNNPVDKRLQLQTVKDNLETKCNIEDKLIKDCKVKILDLIEKLEKSDFNQAFITRYNSACEDFIMTFTAHVNEVVRSKAEDRLIDLCQNGKLNQANIQRRRMEEAGLEPGTNRVSLDQLVEKRAQNLISDISQQKERKPNEKASDFIRGLELKELFEQSKKSPQDLEKLNQSLTEFFKVSERLSSKELGYKIKEFVKELLSKILNSDISDSKKLQTEEKNLSSLMGNDVKLLPPPAYNRGNNQSSSHSR